jgi:hypothetical protein
VVVAEQNWAMFPQVRIEIGDQEIGNVPLVGPPFSSCRQWTGSRPDQASIHVRDRGVALQFHPSHLGFTFHHTRLIVFFSNRAADRYYRERFLRRRYIHVPTLFGSGRRQSE